MGNTETRLNSRVQRIGMLFACQPAGAQGVLAVVIADPAAAAFLRCHAFRHLFFLTPNSTSGFSFGFAFYQFLVRLSPSTSLLSYAILGEIILI